MRVVKTVLRHLEDDKPLKTPSLRDGPLAELMMKYNDAALAHDLDRRFGFPPVTTETLARDFKFYLSKLPAEDQITMLNEYLDRHGSPPLVLRTPTEDEDEESMEQEERRLKHWMLKLRTYGAIALVTFFFVIVGAMIVLMVQNHQLPNNAIFGTLLTTATEIIKVMIGSK